MKKIIGITLVGLLIVFVLIQFIPYGHQNTNPQVISEPNWDSPQTREFAQRACFDCHSNEVVWPWYSNIAPVSWMVQHDVDEGRQYLNFSDWGRAREAHEIPEAIQGGYMPPSIFLIMHPNARLDQAEKDAFIRGMQATVRNQ